MVERWTTEQEVRVSKPTSPCCVLEQDTFLPKVLVIPRKRWLRPDMTEKLLTGTLNLNTNEQDHDTAHFNFRPRQKSEALGSVYSQQRMTKVGQKKRYSAYLIFKG